jgi:hypothetical protein
MPERIGLFRILLSAAMFSAIMCASCTKRVTASELPGSYLADYGFAKETVTIDSDGHFTQSVRVESDGKTANSRGTWRFDESDHNIYFSSDFLVVVDGFGNLNPEFEHPMTRATSILPVTRQFGRIQIGLDPRVPYKRT